MIFSSNNYKLNDKTAILIQFLVLSSIFEFIKCSSVESCLSAYGVDISQTFSQNTTLPIECQCSEAELVCTNSVINNPHVNESSFPTLSLLFQTSNSSIFYPLPKQTLTFWGYKSLIPEAFNGFKFVNTENANNNGLTGESIHIYFSESYYFPTGTFDMFGNLFAVDRSQWPKLFIEIIDNDISSILILDRAAISDLKVESMRIKYSGPETYLLLDAFDGSIINNLEIRNSPRLVGFTPIESDSNVTIINLTIDNCPTFVFSNRTFPNLDRLSYLTIKSSNLVMVPQFGFWTKFRSLLGLNLRGNQISYIPFNSFFGLESSLRYLDLSNNPLTNLEWTVFTNFSSLTTLDLSFTAITTINSFIRVWPNPAGLKTVVLKGYNNTFDNRTICAFNSDVINKRINLSTTFIEVERTRECDCFIFYIYKEYRKNPENLLKDWILAERTPSCYEKLYQTQPDFLEIEKEENACNFPEILDLFCPKSTTSAATKFITTTSPCFSTHYSQPGQTTIVIGNQTAFSATTPCITTDDYTTTGYTTTDTTTDTTTGYTTTDYTTTSINITEAPNKETQAPTEYTTYQVSSSSTTTGGSYGTVYSTEMESNSTTTTTDPSSTSSSELKTLQSNADNSTALQILEWPVRANSSLFNTASIIIIVVLSVVSLLLLLIILGLIIYFRNRLRIVSSGSGGTLSINRNNSKIVIDEKGNKHIYRV